MKTSITVLVLFSYVGFAAPEPQPTPIRLSAINCEVEQVVFEIPTARAEALPQWNWHPESDTAPPLSLKQACVLAKAALKARQPEVDEFEVVKVDICQMPRTGLRHQWFYDVLCSKQTRGTMPKSCDSRAIILMDGTSVEPVIIPKSR